jgi:very-short-patch-repair endonuclease
VTDRQIAGAVVRGDLIRLRGGVFCSPSLDAEAQAAVGAGGRLACVSLLRRAGVWVLDDRGTHAHFTQAVRAPVGVRHWEALREPPDPFSVSPLDAVLEALECLPRRAAVAVLDSALHVGVAERSAVAACATSHRARRRLAESDGRAESGLETLARLVARDLGLRVEPQVRFAGIGRVDLLIEGVVVLEADGDEFHSGLAARRRDRQRDARLAAIDRPVLRFGYEQLVGRPDEVARALIRTVSHHRGVKDSRRVVQKAVRRARNVGWA